MSLQEKADQFYYQWEQIGASLSSCGILLDGWTSLEIYVSWLTTSTCAVARWFWSEINCNRTSSHHLLAILQSQLKFKVRQLKKLLGRRQSIIISTFNF